MVMLVERDSGKQDQGDINACLCEDNLIILIIDQGMVRSACLFVSCNNSISCGEYLSIERCTFQQGDRRIYHPLC